MMGTLWDIIGSTEVSNKRITGTGEVHNIIPSVQITHLTNEFKSLIVDGLRVIWHSCSDKIQIFVHARYLFIQKSKQLQSHVRGDRNAHPRTFNPLTAVEIDPRNSHHQNCSPADISPSALLWRLRLQWRPYDPYSDSSCTAGSPTHPDILYFLQRLLILFF